MNELARDPRQVGNAIRAARKRKGWSQSKLANLSGLRQEQVSVIENGRASTKLQTLLAVLSALGLELQIAARATGDWNLER